MNIQILELLENINPQVEGVIVIIDVFRAFSTAAYAFAKGAKAILSVADLDIAYQLKKAKPTYLLMGEREGFKQKYFNFGNSPKEISQADIFNKTLIHTSSAGTQGLIKAAQGKAEILCGSFVNAYAIARYIKNSAFENVYLVAMGEAGLTSAKEDLICAEYLKDLLLNQANCASHYCFKVRYFTQNNEAKHIQKGIWHPGDMDMCLSMNHFSFILKVKNRQSDYVTLEKVPVF